MNELRIRLHERSIVIEQANEPGEPPATISLRPEQLPVVIEWLGRIQKQLAEQK